MNRVAQIRRRTYEVLEVAAPGDQLSRWADVYVAMLVAGNILAVVLESVAPIRHAYHDLFRAFDHISIVSFSAEFLLRLWATAEESDEEVGPLRARLRYLFSPMAIADLLAILPFYLSAFISLDLRYLRVLRLLRVLKLTRYSASLGRIIQVFRMQRKGLAMSALIMALAIIFAASVVYVAENRAQPEAFASIPAAMWWAVCTLTTVGYGDVTPVTVTGKLLASVITLFGVGMVALPTSLLASGFSELANRDRQLLEAEARRAMEDGFFSRDEEQAYTLLAQNLGVEPSLAREIVVQAQQGVLPGADSDCPHCGKELAI